MFKSSLLTNGGWFGGHTKKSSSWLHILTTPESTAEVLLQEMLVLYWEAVQNEIGNIILTLKTWDRTDYAEAFPEDEDHSVHGFDTFLDQVSESSRHFAFSYGKQRDISSKDQKLYRCPRGPSVGPVGLEVGLGLKTAVRQTLQRQKTEPIKVRRARLLLQSAGFLDIDKLASYGAPLVTHGFWRKPRYAQLTLARFDRKSMPHFSPLHCNGCDKTIRGIHFWCSEAGCKQSIDSGSRYYICEDCFRSKNQTCGPHLIKYYKHCILQETITPEVSHVIYRCRKAPRIDANGQARSLFPVDPSLRHHSSANRANRCGLLKLGGQVAEAKHRGILTKQEKREVSLKKKKKKKKQQQQQYKKAKVLKKQNFTKELDADFLEVKGSEPTDRVVDGTDNDTP
ncbi:hypothetical protein MMC18_003656 [Xylographa bjoerkii]|nr:hypothetical protein [Xylographa bjoerkii]